MKQLAILRACIRIGIAVLIIGTLLTLLHQVGGYEVSAIGSGLILIAYPLLFFKRANYSPLNIIKLLLVETFLIRFLFRMGNLPGGHFFNYAVPVLLVAWLIMGGSQEILKKGPKENLNFFQRNTSYFLALFIVIIVIGSLIKVMHWPGANMLLIVGFIGAGLLALISIRRPF